MSEKTGYIGRYLDVNKISEDAKKNMPERDKDDHYPTPIEYADAMWEGGKLVPSDWMLDGGSTQKRAVLDVGAGGGVFAESLRKKWGIAPIITGIDRRSIPAPKWYNHWLIQDFHTFDFKAQRYKLIIGNPPYDKIDKIVHKSYNLLANGGYLCMLLPETFLYGQSRAYGFSLYPPKKIVHVSNRISFTGAPNNIRLNCYVLWQKGYGGPTYTDWIVVIEEGRKKRSGRWGGKRKNFTETTFISDAPSVHEIGLRKSIPQKIHIEFTDCPECLKKRLHLDVCGVEKDICYSCDNCGHTMPYDPN